jgi:hypothetical protein
MGWLNDHGGLAAWIAIPVSVMLGVFPLLLKKKIQAFECGTSFRFTGLACM